jgi:hypothetical protein
MHTTCGPRISALSAPRHISVSYPILIRFLLRHMALKSRGHANLTFKMRWTYFSTKFTLIPLTQPREHFCRFRLGHVDFSVINAVATAFRRRHKGKLKRCSQKRRYDSMKTAFWGLDHSA